MITRKAGFTLIELLVVVLMIGILSAVALPQYKKAVIKAHFVEMQIAVRAIRQAQQHYFMTNGVYASEWEELDISLAQRGKYYSCSLNNGQDRVNCYLSGFPPTKSFLTYIFWYKEGEFLCCSYKDTNYEADYVCQSITGKNTWTNNCGDEGYCRCYSSK